MASLNRPIDSVNVVNFDPKQTQVLRAVPKRAAATVAR